MTGSDPTADGTGGATSSARHQCYMCQDSGLVADNASGMPWPMVMASGDPGHLTEEVEGLLRPKPCPFCCTEENTAALAYALGHRDALAAAKLAMAQGDDGYLKMIDAKLTMLIGLVQSLTENLQRET